MAIQDAVDAMVDALRRDLMETLEVQIMQAPTPDNLAEYDDAIKSLAVTLICGSMQFLGAWDMPSEALKGWGYTAMENVEDQLRALVMEKETDANELGFIAAEQKFLLVLGRLKDLLRSASRGMLENSTQFFQAIESTEQGLGALSL